MQLYSQIDALRHMRQGLPSGTRIGLVPTMGALHQGHAALIQRAVAENDFTIVSIFVNPTQFGPQEDLSRYPRDLQGDQQLIESLGADAIFAPITTDIYPHQARFYFEIRDLADKLCGASRPGHMNGVVQIVSILFHLCQPTHAYFGLKDYQQFVIIQRLVEELHFPLEVVPCPIVREADGLAMSSRNVYLSPEERQQAVGLSRVLQHLRAERATLPSVEAARQLGQELLQAYPLVQLDYLEILDGRTLAPLPNLPEARHPHAFIAAFLGKTRLIDNLALS